MPARPSLDHEAAICDDLCAQTSREPANMSGGGRTAGQHGAPEFAACDARAWRDGARRMREVGWAHVPGALDPVVARWLADRMRKAPLMRLAPQVGEVTQHGRMAVLPVSEWPEAVDALARAAQAALELDGWRPNESCLMVYERPDAGIGAHRDHRRYATAVAIFSLWGEAGVDIVRDRGATEVEATIDCRAGDLVLLRGGAAGEPATRRPLHRVRGPARGSRGSLAFRMDTSAGVVA
jgi:hypothetical protein